MKLNRLYYILIILFFVTNNLFCQWFQQTSWANNYLNSMFFLDYNTGYICGNNILIKTTNGGINWYHTSIIVNIYSNYFINTNTGYIVGDPYNCQGTVMKTTDGSNSWTLQNPNTMNKLYSVFVVPQTLGNVAFAVGDSGTIVKTTNGGNNWYLMTSGTNKRLYSVYFIDANTGFACGVNRSIIKTTDSGIKWSTIFTQPIDAAFYSITFTNNLTGYVACGTYIGGYAYDEFKTTNSGLNWNGFSNAGGYSICFPSTNHGFAVAGGGYIYKTINSGNNWYVQNSGTTKALHSVFFIDQNTGWAIGDSGIILKTTNGGEPIGIKKISNELPENFQLFQNYPNPFNPTTVIKFQVVSYRLVNLVIYDMLGKIISNPVNAQLQPGIYEVTWDGSNFASGIYFFNLTSGNIVQTKRMVLLK